MRATVQPVEIDNRDIFLRTKPVNARALVSALRGARRIVGDRPRLGLAVVVDAVGMGDTLCRAFRGAVPLPECIWLIRTAVQTEVRRASR